MQLGGRCGWRVDLLLEQFLTHIDTLHQGILVFVELFLNARDAFTKFVVLLQKRSYVGNRNSISVVIMQHGRLQANY